MTRLSRKLKTIFLVTALLVLFLVPNALSMSSSISPPPSYTCSGSLPASNPMCDPYANFSSYQNYLESFYQSSQTTPGFRAYPISDPSSNDYCNYWLDDSGKMLSSFSYFGNTQYATDAASFIMDNSINSNGFTYLPERIVQGCSTYLHVNSSQLASPLYNVTYSPVLNPAFAETNTSSNQPLDWTASKAGAGSDTYEQNQSFTGLCTDGAACTLTEANGAGSASYYQKENVANTAVFFAHDDSAIGENGGIIGNFTASFNSNARTTSASATSSSQMVFGFDTYPVLIDDTVIPANSTFSISAVVKADATVSAATFGVQVNKVCNGYSTETSPWGGEQTQTVTLTTTPTLFTGTISTGTSATTVAAGCAFHVIVYVNPNTVGSHTITINWDSKSQEMYAKIPWIPALANLAGASATMGFAIHATNASTSNTGYYYALVTTGGTILFTNGTVDQADIPNLATPVKTFVFDYGNTSDWANVNIDAAAVASGVSGTIPEDSLIKYVEIGTTSTLAQSAAYWDDIFYILDEGLGNSPWPVTGQYMTGGYYYANNGLMGVANYSSIDDTHVYEKSMSVAIITDTENRTNYQLHNSIVKQAFGGSPYITDFFIWDSDNNASGYMSRQIFPYAINIGSVPYRLYISGGNGSSINMDFWIGVNVYQNVYAWINETMTAGTDYLEPTLAAQNLGVNAVQFNDLNFGLGSLDTFMRYNPYWSYLDLSNGTIVQQGHGFFDSPLNATSYFVYQKGTGGFANGVNPNALLWTGFDTPEFADGFLVQPQNASAVKEIDYVTNFFGHSLRILSNLNGQVLSMGQTTTPFSFKFTTLAKSLWTEPKVLLNVFLNDVVTGTNGMDMSYAGTWGFDTYGLASWGLKSNNATVLNFAKNLWNSQYQDVIQRLHPAATSYNPTQQPTIYYRALYLFTIAGLELYPNNSTVTNLAMQVATYAIGDQLNPHGLPFGLEEDGWAVDLLSILYGDNLVSAQNQQSYNGYIQDILNNFDTNATYTGALSESAWPLFPTTYLTDTPSVWNLNSNGTVNAYCNHPQNVFRCGEYSYAVNLAYLSDPSLAGSYNSPASLVAATNFWAMSYTENLTSPGSPCLSLKSCGTSIDARYADNSGSSNTETDPVSVLGLIAWMENMQNATGTYISSLRGGGLQYIQYDTYESDKYTSLIVGLSSPSRNANITINYAGIGSPPEFVTDDGVGATYSLNTTSDDIIFTNIASTLMLLWPNGGTSRGGGGSCAPSAVPVLSSETVRVQIGTNSTVAIPVSNAKDNVSITIQKVSYSAPSGIGVSTRSGLPLTLHPLASSGSFQVGIDLALTVRNGSYTVIVTAPYVTSCSGTGQMSTTIQILAQTTPVTQPSNIIPQALYDWWPEILLLVVVIVALSGAIIYVRRQD